MENIKKINKSKRYNKDFELVLLTVALLMTADRIDYKNSFKDDIEEVSVVSEYNDHYEGEAYNRYNMNYDVHIDPFLVSEDSESFVRRTIKNNNEVKKLKRKKR